MPHDLTTARKWYEKAAAQGNAWAQAQLALM
jgi:TPR repeat protein